MRGYTEWRGDAELPISIGWNWCIHVHERAACCQREELPRTNIQLLDEKGLLLAWEDNLQVLATWVDAQHWQGEVAQAIGA